MRLDKSRLFPGRCDRAASALHQFLEFVARQELQRRLACGLHFRT
jgi:hypothetical protein